VALKVLLPKFAVDSERITHRGSAVHRQADRRSAGNSGRTRDSSPQLGRNRRSDDVGDRSIRPKLFRESDERRVFRSLGRLRHIFDGSEHHVPLPDRSTVYDFNLAATPPSGMDPGAERAQRKQDEPGHIVRRNLQIGPFVLTLNIADLLVRF